MDTNPTPKIHAAMVAVMRDIEAIEKSRTADAGGPRYQFRGIDDIYNALHPILATHGVYMLASYEDRVVIERQSSRGTAMFYVTLVGRFHFTAEDGSSVECSAIGEAMDSSDKATNKAMSVALKYAVMQTFFIPTVEPKDPENDHVEVKPREIKAQPKPLPVASNVAKQMLAELKAAGYDTAAKVGTLYQEVLSKARPESDEERQKVIDHLLAGGGA